MTTTIAERDVALIDLIDRLLGGGVVIAGDITLAAADVDLGLRAAACADRLRGDCAREERVAAVGERLVIELYAVVEHPGPRLPTLARLAGRPPTTRLAAIYAPATDGGDFPPERLWRHEEIVEAPDAGSRTLLPVRYGTRLDDERAATRLFPLTDREETAGFGR